MVGAGIDVVGTCAWVYMWGSDCDRECTGGCHPVAYSMMSGFEVCSRCSEVASKMNVEQLRQPMHRGIVM